MSVNVVETPAADAPPSVGYRSAAELEQFRSALAAVPQDEGTVQLVVARPAEGERAVLDVGRLDLTVGLVGDNWAERPSSRSADGGPHPRMQLNVMSYPMAAFIAIEESRVPLAGDQLYLDLDLSHGNLPVGTQLLFGDPGSPASVIEVTEEPHTGCKKFVARFGAEAMRFVNGPVGRPLRLRGLNAVVVQPGEVRPGDQVTVRRPRPSR